MTFYVITAVRFNEAGEISHVRWGEVDGAEPRFEVEPHVVELDRVVEAFDRGDAVELIFPTPQGNVSGGRVIRKVLPGGHETIMEERQIEGRMLSDMPTF